MKTFSVRVDHDDGSWSMINLKARTYDQALKEIKTLDIKDEEARMLETAWREICTTPHIINIDKL